MKEAKESSKSDGSSKDSKAGASLQSSDSGSESSPDCGSAKKSEAKASAAD